MENQASSIELIELAVLHFGNSYVIITLASTINSDQLSAFSRRKHQS